VSGNTALKIGHAWGIEPPPVIDGGRIVGLLHRADSMRWLALDQLKATVDV